MEPFIKIRFMEQKDIEQVVKIEQECFSVPWSQKSFEDALLYDTYQFLVAEDENQLLGYIGIIITGTEADITNVAVYSQYRKKGIGQRLVSAALEQVQKQQVEVIFLEVRKSNEKAIRLYKKFQFYPISVRKNYYQSPIEDAIIMSADLSTRKTK